MACENCTNCDRCLTFINFRDKYKAITQFEYTIPHPSAMVLGLTNQCNLSCPYCFCEQNNCSMSLETATKAVEWILTLTEKPFINFFGGEPLLYFDSIIVPLVEKYFDKVTFGITTNGILLNEDKVDFFYKYDIQPLLSFDGVPEVQNTQRPAKKGNSFNQVLNNIPYLLLRFPQTVMRATLTKNSIPYFYETVLMAESLGFKNITFCPNAFEDWNKDDEGKLRQELQKTSLHIYKQLLKEDFQLPIQVNPLIKNIQTIEEMTKGNIKFNNNIERCGLGTTSCAVTPSGDIIPCQEKASNPTFVIGNVNNGIDEVAHKEFLQWYFEKINNIVCDRGCSERERLLCLSNICPSRLEDMGFQISTSSCAFTRQFARASARLHFLCANSGLIKIQTYLGGKESE